MTTLANQYLREMGIEVWLLREHGLEARHTPVPEPPPVAPAARATQPPAETSRREQPAPGAGPETAPPSFHLCFMNGATTSLVFSIPPDADAVPPEIRRLAADVLLALEGKADAVINNVRWRMVQSKHMDQSAEAARVVLRQRLEHCAPCLLVFGDEAAGWIGDLSSRRGQIVNDIDSYRAAPLTKRELWQTLAGIKSVPSQ